MRSINSLIIYPPKVYARIPYLAPFLLKGYIEANSCHKVDCLDLNIRLHKSIWTGEIFTHVDHEKLKVSQVKRIEIVNQYGTEAYNAMRFEGNYSPQSRERISDANEILYQAEQLEIEISEDQGALNAMLPDRFEAWDEVVLMLENSLSADFLKRELENIDLDSYDVIGFSGSYIEQLAYCFLAAKFLKSNCNFKGKLVIGGSGFTHIHQFALEDLSCWQYFDFGIVYEGEVSFLELLNGLATGDDSFKNENIISCNDDKINYVNAIHKRPVVHSVPDFSTLEHLYPTPKPIYPILTSKGCYWGKCTFCTHHEGYGQGYSPAGNAVISDSITHVANLGGHFFYFVDEALPAAKIKFIAELFSNLENQGKINSPQWMSECRVEKYSADEKYLQILKESGCKILINGMETGSQRIMDLMKKGVQISLAKEYARNSRKVGIQTAWMFFIGFPSETLAECKETFDLVEECKSDIDYATIGTFGLEKGSPMWSNPEAFGITEIIGKNDPYRIVFDYRDQDGILRTRSELKTQFSEFLNYYPGHYELFTKIIDRSCSLFFQTEESISIV